MIRCFLGTVSVLLLLAGLGAVVILIKIGGKSDGPGALFFYIVAFIGLGGGLTLLFSLPPGKEP